MTSTVKPQQSRRLAPLVCLVGCGLGALVMVAGAAWSMFGGASMAYSPEQAKEWEEASAAWHSATIGHTDEHSPEAKAAPGDREATVAAARERFQRADDELKHARFVKNSLGSVLVWTGLAIAAAFGVGYLASRAE